MIIFFFFLQKWALPRVQEFGPFEIPCIYRAMAFCYLNKLREQNSPSFFVSYMVAFDKGYNGILFLSDLANREAFFQVF